MSDMTEEEWTALTDDLLQHVRAMEIAEARHRSKLDMRGTAAVLHLLHHNPDGLTPTQIARLTHVSTARVATTLNALEDQGLATREPDPVDRRRVIARITPAGEEDLRAHKAQMVGDVEGVLKRLGPDDAQALVRIIGKVSRIIGASPEGTQGDVPDVPECPSPFPMPPFPSEEVDAAASCTDAHPAEVLPFSSEGGDAR